MPELSVGRRVQECLELLSVEVADVVVVWVAGLINRSHWVCRTPTSLQCVGADRVQQAEVVADVLDRLYLDSFGPDQLFDEVEVARVQRAFREDGHVVAE